MRARRVSQHALDRYQEHHPHEDEDGVFRAVAMGITVDKERTRELLAREYTKGEDTYVLAFDRQGIFVLAGGVVVTYLRLSKWHQQVMEQRYPVADDFGFGSD